MISGSEVASILETGKFPEDQFFLVLASEAVSFAWSPCGNYLATGSGSPESVLRIFDIRRKRLVYSERRHVNSIYYLNWSPGGNYLISSSPPAHPRMIIWRCKWEEPEGDKSPMLSIMHEILVLPPFPNRHFDENPKDWFGYHGFKKCAISPNEKLIAGNAGVQPTDEYLVFFDLPDLSEVARVDLLYEDHKSVPWGSQSQLHSLSWMWNSRRLYFCQYEALHFIPIDEANQPGSVQTTEFLFDHCCCNPKYDVIALGRGRWEDFHDPKGEDPDNREFVGSLISIRHLPDMKVISEFTGPAGIVDLRWSADGNKLWAMCHDGNAVQAQLPIAFRK